MNRMSAFTRFAAAVVFAAAALAQPLALDACAVSCEAARAARTATVAPPCHHTTSCALQIVQPTSPGSTTAVHAVIPTTVEVSLPRPAAVTAAWQAHESPTSSGPPLITQLRV